MIFYLKSNNQTSSKSHWIIVSLLWSMLLLPGYAYSQINLLDDTVCLGSPVVVPADTTFSQVRYEVGSGALPQSWGFGFHGVWSGSNSLCRSCLKSIDSNYYSVSLGNSNNLRVTMYSPGLQWSKYTTKQINLDTISESLGAIDFGADTNNNIIGIASSDSGYLYKISFSGSFNSLSSIDTLFGSAVPSEALHINQVDSSIWVISKRAGVDSIDLFYSNKSPFDSLSLIQTLSFQGGNFLDISSVRTGNRWSLFVGDANGLHLLKFNGTFADSLQHDTVLSSEGFAGINHFLFGGKHHLAASNINQRAVELIEWEVNTGGLSKSSQTPPRPNPFRAESKPCVFFDSSLVVIDVEERRNYLLHYNQNLPNIFSEDHFHTKFCLT